ncbi:MAG: hypothetical protein GXY85_04835 [Candidatus Brocadiaceae bacterium]|nr:hypothetical protein [Candidatus Brocadiaceae bacterium]
MACGHAALVLTFMLLTGGPTGPPGPAVPVVEDPAEVFALACEPDADAKTQCADLVRIAKEWPESDWADDALWVLGETARRNRRPAEVVYYWQYLMAAYPETRLEGRTRSLAVYVHSGLAQVEMYVQQTGQCYKLTEGKRRDGDRVFYNAVPFSALPMFVWSGLGESYEELGRLSLAAKAFERAERSAPTGGNWRASCAASAERVRRRLEAHAAGAGSATPPAAAGPVGARPSAHCTSGAGDAELACAEDD